MIKSFKSSALLSVVMVLSLLVTGCYSSTLNEKEKTLPTETTTFSRSSGVVDYDKSYVAFTGSKTAAVVHQCEFESFSVDINLDAENPANLEKAQVEVSVDINSMKTDADGLTKHLLSEDFFGAETYPKARFVSESIVSTGGDNYDITGQLTIKDQTQMVTFTSTITNEFAVFKHQLNRLDFGVGAEGSVDNEVPLEVKVSFKN